MPAGLHPPSPAELLGSKRFKDGAEMTSRHAAQRAIEQLEHARAKFVGAVLNRVDLRHNPYYYSQYYRRGLQRLLPEGRRLAMPSSAARTEGHV
jgi:hypothetical protein